MLNWRKVERKAQDTELHNKKDFSKSFQKNYSHPRYSNSMVRFSKVADRWNPPKAYDLSDILASNCDNICLGIPLKMSYNFLGNKLVTDNSKENSYY